ncbi:MAG: hypothetical protein HRT87_01225 [Legionellales bacterium]|nr:hypothetical protein [Legionellales bacterium]
MADTIRTEAELLNIFRDGQGANSITEQDMRDLIVSMNKKRGGFIDYNDTSTTSSALVVSADTWTTIPNDGLGAFSNDTYKPDGVTNLMNVASGHIDVSELELGSAILIRNDFTITPSANNAKLELRYELGTGGGVYHQSKRMPRLDEGGGVDYRINLSVDNIYMGDLNTKDNPIKIQVKCTSAATLVNSGTVITVLFGMTA